MSTATDARFLAPSEPSSPGLDTDGVEVDLVEVATLAIYETRAWTRVDKNGRIVPDDEAAKNFVYTFFRDNVVVNSDGDIVDDALSVDDLYAKTFPKAFGATSEPVDEDQFKAYKGVLRKLWQYAGTGVRGHCQETAEMEGLDFVMVEKKVFRTSRDNSTGNTSPKQVSVRFFTQNPELIYQLSALPATAKLVKAAEETAKHLQMNVVRHPELTSRVARSAKLALQQSSANLAAITAGKPAAGGPNDDH